MRARLPDLGPYSVEAVGPAKVTGRQGGDLGQGTEVSGGRGNSARRKGGKWGWGGLRGVGVVGRVGEADGGAAAVAPRGSQADSDQEHALSGGRKAGARLGRHGPRPQGAPPPALPACPPPSPPSRRRFSTCNHHLASWVQLLRSMKSVGLCPFCQNLMRIFQTF